MKEPPSRQIITTCTRFLPLILLLIIYILGCSDSTEPDNPGPSPATVSSNIGTDGGTLALTAPGGTTCRLTFPDNALSGTTKISITATSSSSGSLLGSLSKDFLLEPEGLEFEVPVAISITLADTMPAGRAPAILHGSSDGPGILLETQMDGLTFEAALDHFSHTSPVAPTAQELGLYWDSILLEIDVIGLSVDRVRTLASIYLHAQANSGVYGSIDLQAWNIELWAQTNDLVIKGSLRCSGGDPVEGAHILRAAGHIAGIMFFTDLEAEAQQALATCPTGGTVIIDQNPDFLLGAGWSLTGPRDMTGSGDSTLADMPAGAYTMVWNIVTDYIEPIGSVQTLALGETITFTGAYTPDPGGELHQVFFRISDAHGIAEIYRGDFAIARAVWGTDPEGGNNGIYPGDTGWRGGPFESGSYTYQLSVKPNPTYTAYPRANFEIKVDGDLVHSSRLETFDQNATLEETVTLTF